ncbi:hypothetical protein Ahy_A01g000704 [Arachis hypogaea]|uniref:Uncharacterized protein n=1 Tax=Arachis hypogaea TaxID=3818 RepID=A0A445EL54_ARAHY|nr:hypothetical protein Ahy_A01g000704 [Arachis hypogaea]
MRNYITREVRNVSKQDNAKEFGKGKVNCITRLMHSTIGFTTYEVIEQVSNSIFHKFFVTYDADQAHRMPFFGHRQSTITSVLHCKSAQTVEIWENDRIFQSKR